ncbi:hypothetical protein IFM89_011678 [Coptis chinensis]|uniref:XS domain-containing protein n=1 Tax=Coptis chinensis TaxID=261450 RepID=A0A835HQ92_9MAGN|nr:hypothetical protein IFM89_011678 [Coptis chinensis]
MAGGGGGDPKGNNNPSSSHRKSRWESGTKNTSSSSTNNTNPDNNNNINTKQQPIISKPSNPNNNSNKKLDYHQHHQHHPSRPSPQNQQQPLLLPGPAAAAGPTYGLHMLDRRTIALADGSVRSYVALPLDYQDLLPPPPPPTRLTRPGENEYWSTFEGRHDASLKRKFSDGDERHDFARQRQQLLQYGNQNGLAAGTSSPFSRDIDDIRGGKHMRIGGGDYSLSSGHGMVTSAAAESSSTFKHHDVDPQALKKAFLRFVKLLNENVALRANYFENGKQGPLQCLACTRAPKDFQDMHGLIMHAFGSHSAELHVDHLGLHKALCVLMGWNYARVPDNSKAYQSLSTNEADSNKDDLILWPPLVIIHNTNTGRGKDGRMEGMGNKVMDNKLKDLGFGGGKAKSLYGKEGHLGITLVKFGADQSGLKEAVRLAEFLEKEYHGRKGWARAQTSQPGRDDENNPNLVKVDEKTREKQRILYGYLATASDLEKVDFETRKKTSIEIKRDLKP